MFLDVFIDVFDFEVVDLFGGVFVVRGGNGICIYFLEMWLR